jgi:membrane protease subunit HflK
MKAPEIQESPGIQSLTRALGVFFFILKILMVLTFVYFIFSGLFIVEQQKVGLVLRFGRIRGTTLSKQVLTPGLHWAFPYPIDEVIEIEAGRVRKLIIDDFWFKEGFMEIIQKEDGEEEEVGGGPLEPGKDGYCITGDVNIVHLGWSVEYKVNDPVEYFLNLARTPLEETVKGSEDFDEIELRAVPFVRMAVANAVVEQAGRVSIDDILFNRKERFRKAVLARANGILDKRNTGIALTGFDYHRPPRPPRDVRHAFNSVGQAHNEASAEKNKARAYRNRLQNEADAEATAIVAAAEAYRDGIEASAKADAMYLTKLYEKFPQNSLELDVFLRQHHLQVLDRVLTNVKAKYVTPEKLGEDARLWLYLGKDPKDLEPEEEKKKEASEGGH